MFRELMPILEKRTVMLTLSRVDDTTIRVCVIPKRVGRDGKDDIGENALCTPLTVTGTVEEMDQEFAAQLSTYSGGTVRLGSNLAEIEASHHAAIKAVEAENKKQLDLKRGKNTKPSIGVTDAKPGPLIKDGKPVFGTKDGQGPAAPGTLFDGQADAAPDRTSVAVPSEVSTTNLSTEDPSASTNKSPVETPLTGSQAELTYPD